LRHTITRQNLNVRIAKLNLHRHTTVMHLKKVIQEIWIS